MAEAIVTPFCRVAFSKDLFVAAPVDKDDPNSKKKYGCYLIWMDQRPVYEAFNKLGDLIAPAGSDPATWTDLQKDYAADPTLLIQVRRHLAAVCKEKWGDDKTKWPAPFDTKDLKTYVVEESKKWPIRDGNAVKWNGFQGHLFTRVTANEDYKPGIGRLNLKDKREVAMSEVPGGLIVRANAKAYAWYNPKGGHGVSLGLNHVQLILDDGVRYSASAGPIESAFGAWGDEDMLDPANCKTGEGVTTSDDF